MVEFTRQAKPEERFPDFEGAPAGWSSWPKFRQEKYLALHPEIAEKLSKATSQQVQVNVNVHVSMPPASASPAVTVTPVVTKTSVTTTNVPSVLMDIRQWNEDVDGIPAERIRNCIIFQLDHKKDKFYREALTEGFIRRTLRSGITGARKLHEDTPPGWTRPDPDPLVRYKTVIEDGREREIPVYRRAKNAEEKQKLLEAGTSRGKIKDRFIPLLVDPNCPECKGNGYRRTFPYADKPRYKHIIKHVLCGCILRLDDSTRDKSA